ncbi:cytochrome c oxidase subunit 7A [Puccinia sorghi]|uniref:Cytochrome c oxidase subunit 7A n=1 Tax=Puccinia sorghi TaxID=27349 RepID=A0A0L6V258_9BASI|nr:cytochrome c oxidase subunit 7A [Puccinia sorghi]
MAIAPITGKLRKRILLDLSVSLGLGTAAAYTWWYGYHVPKRDVPISPGRVHHRESLLIEACPPCPSPIEISPGSFQGRMSLRKQSTSPRPVRRALYTFEASDGRQRARSTGMLCG